MTEKKKPGRPKLEIDGELVEKLAGLHCTMKEIAAVVGCSVDTLERRFADVIEKGRDAAKASLKRKQFEVAMGGDRTMLIWLGKQYLDQSDRERHEHTGKDGGPIAVESVADDILARLDRMGKRIKPKEKELN